MSDETLEPDKIPEISPAMLADLEAINRGQRPPDREWHSRPWKTNEPCWAVFQGPGGDIHILPCRVALFDPSINSTPFGQEATPLLNVNPDPFGGWIMSLPQPAQLRKVMPRLVVGESW